MVTVAVEARGPRAPGPPTVAALTSPASWPSLPDDIHAAALRCFARDGIGPTSLDDVAREARCSRATAYRAVAGGKDRLLALVVAAEARRLLAVVDAAIVPAADLGEALVAGLSAAGRVLAGHRALARVRVHEPEVLLPFVAFRRVDALLAVAASAIAVRLARFPLRSAPDRAGEIVARVVLSHLLDPSPELDLADEGSVRRFVTVFLLPALGPSPDPSLDGRPDGSPGSTP